MLAVISEMGLMTVHEENRPPSKRPILIVERDGCSAFNEKRNEDLDAIDKLLYGRIGQFARPYLKLPTSTRITLDELSGRFPGFGGGILLDLRIKCGLLLKTVFLGSQFPDIIHSFHSTYSPSGIHSFRVCSISSAWVSSTALNFLS